MNSITDRPWKITPRTVSENWTASSLCDVMNCWTRPFGIVELVDHVLRVDLGAERVVDEVDRVGDVAVRSSASRSATCVPTSVPIATDEEQERDQDAQQDRDRRPSAPPAARREPVDARLDRQREEQRHEQQDEQAERRWNTCRKRERERRNRSRTRRRPGSPTAACVAVGRLADPTVVPCAIEPRPSGGRVSAVSAAPPAPPSGDRHFLGHDRMRTHAAVAAWAMVRAWLGRRRCRSRVVGPDAATRARRAVRLATRPGWFEPGSPIRRVHSDASMFIGGLRALLLQSMHPLAMAGVAAALRLPARSVGPAAAHRRLPRGHDLRPGQRGAAARSIVVRRVHHHVVGVGPDGRPYSANDPHLLRWVHLAEVDSFLAAHERYGAEPLDGGRARRVRRRRPRRRPGARRVRRRPRPSAACATSSRSYRPELRGTPEAREAARYLLLQPPLPLASAPGLRRARRRGGRADAGVDAGPAATAVAPGRRDASPCDPPATPSPAPSAGPCPPPPTPSAARRTRPSLRRDVRGPVRGMATQTGVALHGRAWARAGARSPRSATTMPARGRATPPSTQLGAQLGGDVAVVDPRLAPRALDEQRRVRPVGLEVDATDQLVAEQERQHVVPVLAPRRRRVDLDPVVEAEHPLGAGRGSTRRDRTG